MTKKMNNKPSAKRKLLPAIGMLTVSAMMLSSSTYAWFTMNKSVEVTGMTLRTKVSGNLLVCGDNVEASYTSSMIQTRSALLEPVSSTTGLDGSFWYTVKAKANGDAATDSDYVAYSESTDLTNNSDKVKTGDWTASSDGAGKTAYDAVFNGTEQYDISGHSATPSAAFANAYGYVDYVIYLKATSDAANQELRLTECNLLYNNAGITDSATGDAASTDNDLAWRVAIFAEEIQNKGNGTTTDAVTANGDAAKIILKRTGSSNQTDNYAISSNAAPTAMPLNYNTWSGTTPAQYIDKFGTTVGETRYYKVVARVWLEGEDKSCKSSTYAQLTSDYQFAMKFDLGGTDASVTSLQSDTNKVKAASAPAAVTKTGKAADFSGFTVPAGATSVTVDGVSKTVDEANTLIAGFTGDDEHTVVYTPASA